MRFAFFKGSIRLGSYRKIQKRVVMKTKLLACLFLSLMLGGCLSSITDMQSELFGSRPSEAQFAQMDYTTPGEIEAVYAENTLDADKKYNGKWVKVRGSIDGSPAEVKDMYHKVTGYSITLGNEKKSGANKSARLYCTFPLGPETEAALRGLKRGQVVEVSGRFTEYKPSFRGPFLREAAIVRVVK